MTNELPVEKEFYTEVITKDKKRGTIIVSDSVSDTIDVLTDWLEEENIQEGDLDVCYIVERDTGEPIGKIDYVDGVPSVVIPNSVILSGHIDLPLGEDIEN